MSFDAAARRLSKHPPHDPEQWRMFLGPRYEAVGGSLARGGLSTIWGARRLGPHWLRTPGVCSNATGGGAGHRDWGYD